MKDSKLIEILKTFSQAEFTEFGKFVKSPFYNESKKLIELYEFYKKYFPDFKNVKFTKENAFKKIYGEDVYHDKKIRDRFTDMLKLVEKYMAVVGLRKTMGDEKILTLYEYQKRNLTNYFYKKYDEIKLTYGKSKVKDTAWLYDNYAMESIKGLIFESKNSVGKRKHSNKNMEVEVEYFVKFFTTKMLLYYNTMSNWSLQYNYKFDYKLYEPIMKFIEERNYIDPPIIRAVYLILKMREDKENENYYFELKKIFEKSYESFNPFDKIVVCAGLYNDAERRYTEGNEKFASERFEMIKLQLKYKILLVHDGLISREQFLNAVLVPISLGKLQWAKKFMEDYKDKLPPHVKNDAVAYATAYIKYSQKDYDGALKELLKIKGGDYIYYLRIKTLQSRIYFEQAEYDKLISLIDSFKHYVTSNPAIPEYNIKRYLNYNSVLHKLVMLSMKYDEYKLTKLIKDIAGFTNNEVPINKVWLLAMAKKLEKKPENKRK